MGDKLFLARAYRIILGLEDTRRRLRAFMSWAAGPLIAGVRPAALIRMPRGDLATAWAAWGRELCGAWSLSALPLRESPGGTLIFLFRRRALARKALTGIPARFLAALGYPVRSGLEASLELLRTRFEKPGKFPHEIGIFLGYPPGDVAGFRSGKPSPYPCRGYWKVYHRPERAERTFAYLDAARIKLVKEFL
ncbi:MAG: DUF3793 family protein [Treponema sp.]|jgi:hypothetical protein|nr:DUF3793 family protein [Treponema sp.]